LARGGRGGRCWLPLAALMATDYFLTVYSYHYTFAWQLYAATWAWYGMAMALGQILLRARTTVCARGGGSAAGADLVFPGLELCGLGQRLRYPYPHTLGGLGACYAAGVPFYRNDLASTAIVAGLAFGLPVLVRRMSAAQAQVALAGK
jgi:hypothetical protein